ncbi:MAG: hypothetical protein OXC40_07870 [Proteobacteria bacterium]|nr:hypothetical protein [Pseudomonadota bacterium]
MLCLTSFAWIGPAQLLTSCELPNRNLPLGPDDNNNSADYREYQKTTVASLRSEEANIEELTVSHQAKTILTTDLTGNEEDQESSEVYLGIPTTITLQLSHPSERWWIKSYYIGGGRNRDNNSHTLDDGDDGKLIIRGHTFTKKTNLIFLTIRNRTQCDKWGLSKDQCIGKHSLRGVGKSLETYVIETIDAKSQQDIALEAPVEPAPKEPKIVSQEEYDKW